MGILAAKVLGQASLVPESVGGQAWYMGTGTSLMTGPWNRLSASLHRSLSTGAD